MKSQDVRSSFVDFFADRGHRVSRSSSLVPHGDQTLLFTNAGMVPFKNAFLGLEKPAAPRAVSVQKCMRVSGKHNDLENVGPSHRHHTFFEMLGNFSFGDYFKEDAIRFAWDLVTEVWGIPGEHLWATVFEEDDEAAALWPKLTALTPEKVRRCGAADNFWAMGDTGPCGPCSEIFVDLEPERSPVAFEEGNESGRYIEIWNLVFMQFVRDESGRLEPLPNPSIDTGAGLERVAAVLQQKDSNYDSDLFEPLLSAAAALAEIERGATREGEVALRVIGDHLRATTFLLADGVIPSNEGRGYVLRRILRRAVRHGMNLGFTEPFLHRLLPVVREVMGPAYPELEKTESASVVTVETEERKFLETLALGSRQVQDAIGAARERGASVLDGESVFRFYDTYGLPLEVIEEIAEEERFGIDRAGFDRQLETQRSRSRAALGGAQRELGVLAAVLSEADAGANSEFVGYFDSELDASTVTALLSTGEGAEPRSVDALSAGEQGVAVLDRTPFYAEAGGQVGDRGSLAWPDGTAAVIDTRKKDSGHFHFVEVREGRLAAGQKVRAQVDPNWRRPTQRNHTATHLLHAALRHVLGEGVRQAGSLVAPDRLRFDFTYGEPLTPDEISRVEDLVNRWILQAEETSITPERDFEEAVASGAMALFGEKYGDRVRTVEVPPLSLVEEGGDGEAERLESLELCGGCHVGNTGEIGLFVIMGERGVASGVRRIEARTGEGAREHVAERLGLFHRVAQELGVEDEQVPREVASLVARKRELEGELKRLRLALVSGSGTAEEEILVDGVRIVAREVPAAPVNEIRTMADTLRGKLGSGVVVLGSRDRSRVSLVTAVSADLTQRVHAGNLAREIGALVDGKGGGRPDFAQAGGKHPEKLNAALAAVPGLVKQQLGAH